MTAARRNAQAKKQREQVSPFHRLSSALSAHHRPSPHPGALTHPCEVSLESIVPENVRPSSPATEKPPFVICIGADGVRAAVVPHERDTSTSFRIVKRMSIA